MTRKFNLQRFIKFLTVLMWLIVLGFVLRTIALFSELETDNGYFSYDNVEKRYSLCIDEQDNITQEFNEFFNSGDQPNYSTCHYERSIRWSKSAELERNIYIIFLLPLGFYGIKWLIGYLFPIHDSLEN